MRALVTAGGRLVAERMRIPGTGWIARVTDTEGNVLGLFERGVLRVPEIRVMDLSEAAEAHRLSEAGHTRGKIVLRP